MENLRIATWNIKNSYFNIDKNQMKAAAVIQLLEDKDLDILTLQEVNPMLVRKIEENLKKVAPEYKITSHYEETRNPIKNLRVEYNVIISRISSYIHSYSEPLSYLPKGFDFVKNIFSLRKRNVMCQMFNDEFIINTTHLDHASQELGKRQMNQVMCLLKDEVYKTPYDVVLTGNLNKKTTEQNMIDFTNQLADIEIKVVDNSHKTYVNHDDNQPVDYVAIPNSWETVAIDTLENYDDISSHRPVVVEVQRKK